MKQKLFLASLLLPALFGGSGNQPYHEKVGEQALSQINWDWKSLLGNWVLDFLPARIGYLGRADSETSRIDIWIRSDQTPAEVAGVIAHELAHRVDFLFLTPEQRAEWRKIRGIPKETPWFPPKPAKMLSSDSPPSDNKFVAGDFARCVARTIQGETVEFKSPLGPSPTMDQQQLIRQWLAQINTAGN